MPAPAGTTLINVGWTTNINANCTYGGVMANGNGTTTHYVTRTPLYNGFSETMTISCQDVSNGSNTTSRGVSISVANPPALNIFNQYYTDQGGNRVTMPAPSSSTYINVAWSTNLNANCTYNNVGPQNGDGTTSHYATIPVSSGYNLSAYIRCTEVSNSGNSASLYAPISVQ
jgi:hypothetical protein